MIRLEQAEKQYKNFHLDCSIGGAGRYGNWLDWP